MCAPVLNDVDRILYLLFSNVIVLGAFFVGHNTAKLTIRACAQTGPYVRRLEVNETCVLLLKYVKWTHSS